MLLLLLIFKSINYMPLFMLFNGPYKTFYSIFIDKIGHK